MINSEISEKVQYFSNSVREKLKDNIIKIILFGSRARGDYWAGSDYDFIVIVKNKNSDAVQKVSQAGLEFLNRYDELAVEILYSEEEWQRQQKFPLGINVLREGIAV